MKSRRFDFTFVDYIWFVLLTIIFCFPRIWSTPKVVLCIVIILYGVLNNKYRKLSGISLKFMMFWYAYFLYVIVVGVFRGNANEALAGSVRIGLINATLYFLIIQAIKKDNIKTIVAVTLIISNIYIGIYNILLIAGSILNINTSFLMQLDATAAVGIHTGYSHVVSTNLSMAIFTFPLLLMLLYDLELFKVVSKKAAIVSLVLVALSMILSGRRILWIIIIASLFFYILYNGISTQKKIRYCLILAIVILLVLYIINKTNLLTISGLTSRFIEAFNTTGSRVNYRNEQSKYLIEGFWNHPILGGGSGATISGYQRNENPWVFELSYHVVAFQGGIVGMVLYYSAIITVITGIHRIKQMDRILSKALISTYILVLIANATNPYFTSSFDFEIFLFLPLLLIDSAIERYQLPER